MVLCSRRGCEGTLIILDPRMFTLRDPPPASSSAKEQGFSLSCACVCVIALCFAPSFQEKSRLHGSKEGIDFVYY